MPSCTFKTQLFLHLSVKFNEFSFLIMMLDTSKRRITVLPVFLNSRLLGTDHYFIEGGVGRFSWG